MERKRTESGTHCGVLDCLYSTYHLLVSFRLFTWEDDYKLCVLLSLFRRYGQLLKRSIASKIFFIDFRIMSLSEIVSYQLIIIRSTLSAAHKSSQKHVYLEINEPWKVSAAALWFRFKKLIFISKWNRLNNSNYSLIRMENFDFYKPLRRPSMAACSW